MANIDGIYSGYFSGEGGNGLGLFLFRDGTLTGADAAGVVFDGTFAAIETGYRGTVTVKAPANGMLVQGVSTGPHGITYEMAFEVPSDFAEKPYLLLQTPLGPVTVKLVKLRAL